ncbi:hypothetical protein GK047_18755 [Paenibacillus sp. SYP-B3998]|uniref:Uncharacterized protein n=1 Tax=Paenibacillus sp. SYP-B3998 TaxID=2678564 RepID=A0A6G4A282_9BACL|nr:hypothetical protein [Paenibacillus sp. SYP-B3998]NEW08044.1 hypothetical protein [Paenibacillus sp. SYP-B3998]
MNPIQSVMKMHLRDKAMWFYTPWIIIAASFVINLVLAFSLNEEGAFHSGSVVAIFIYTFVAGTVTLKETFPFALGLSVRRKDYFLGTFATAMMVNLISAVMLAVLSIAEQATNGWGTQLYYFQVEFLKDVPLIGMLGIYFILLVNMYFLGLAISSIHRRFGRNGMFAFFTAVFLLGVVGTFLNAYFHLWGDMFGWLVHHYRELFWWMVPAIVGYLLIAYALLRKATV